MDAITGTGRDPSASIEMQLIDEYLEPLGQTRASVRRLPEVQALRFLRAASDYASLRLAALDARRLASMPSICRVVSARDPDA